MCDPIRQVTLHSSEMSYWMLLIVVVIGLIPAAFAACVVLIHIIWVLMRDLIQENVDLSFLLGKFHH